MHLPIFQPTYAPLIMSWSTNTMRNNNMSMVT